jgi:hypothetical protein
MLSNGLLSEGTLDSLAIISDITIHVVDIDISCILIIDVHALIIIFLSLLWFSVLFLLVISFNWSLVILIDLILLPWLLA